MAKPVVFNYQEYEKLKTENAMLMDKLNVRVNEIEVTTSNHGVKCGRCKCGAYVYDIYNYCPICGAKLAFK